MGSRVRSEPDATLAELVGRLRDDGTRLVRDEVRLAKLELGENLRRGARGVMWLGLAFGLGLTALVSATVFLTALIGRLAGGHTWVGAFVTAFVELALGAWLITRGLTAYRRPSYSLGESREELRRTKDWLAAERAR